MARLRQAPTARFAGMRLIRGGEFLQGAGALYPEEGPERVVRAPDFWIDETPVTNRQFAAFVAATGYVTMAERAPDPRDYPGMSAHMAFPGSAVFTPPVEGAAAARAPKEPNWWAYVFGADWRHPTGPGSSLEGLADHPVVHVAAADAEAFARWARKALPSELEWEYAARGGVEGKIYAWGDELEPEGREMAKIWRGEFPSRNLAGRGLERTAPVGSYPPNGFGLFDMIGNVWEWTSSAYDPGPPAPRPCCAPDGAPAEAALMSHRVLKGGSHLCAPNYCQRYRPAARWLQPVDTSTSHVGFRCIVRR